MTLQKFACIVLIVGIIGGWAVESRADDPHHNYEPYPGSNAVVNNYLNGPRYAAMAGIQQATNTDSLQISAAFTYDKDDKGMEQEGYAIALGQRFCFDDDNCGFFGLNAGRDDFGESYTITSTWIIDP